MSIVQKLLMIIAIYLRVSTPQQEEEGTSLDTQLEACLRLVEAEGYHGAKVDLLREQGSGADGDRPLFGKLRQGVADGRYAAVFIHDSDRAGRDPLQTMIFRYECEQADVPLHFVQGQSGTSDEDRLVQYVEGYVALKERKQIMERTTRGKIATARAGRMPVGASLFGYDYDKVTKTRTINEREAAVVRRIFEMSAAGDGVRRIRSTLVREGIATKKGGQWTRQRIFKMLKNESYMGVTYYGCTGRRTIPGGRGQQVPRPREEWTHIEGFTPPIISAELFEEVQQGLTTGRKRRPAPPRLYLLTQFLWCRKCGNKLRGNSRLGQPRRYLCKECRVGRGHPAIYIDADELEALVWDHLSAAITHPDVLANGLRPHLETGCLDLGREMSRLRREIRKCQQEERRLIKLYATGDFDQQVLQGMVAQGRLLLAEHERDLLLLEQRRAFHEDPAGNQSRLEEHARRISEGLASLDFDAKIATLLAFGVRIVVGGGKISIELYVDPS